MEVCLMKTITTTQTIEKLREIFDTHGLPEIIVSDNGSSSTSVEFKNFIHQNGIVHKTSVPYSPKTNGLAERGVQIFKQSMRKMKEGLVQTKLSRFLFAYRNTPQTTTGISTAELLLKRRPRSHLDQIHPNLDSYVQSTSYS